MNLENNVGIADNPITSILVIFIYFQATVTWDPSSCVLTTQVVPTKAGGKKQTVTRKIVNNELVMVNNMSRVIRKPAICIRNSTLALHP